MSIESVVLVVAIVVVVYVRVRLHDTRTRDASRSLDERLVAEQMHPRTGHVQASSQRVPMNGRGSHD
jgi:hypothetical protein